jgi:FkbM family methyltransferase
MTSITLGLLARATPSSWPQWALYFGGRAVFKATGWPLFSDRQLRLGSLKICADIHGNNGLAFLHEIAVKGAYDRFSTLCGSERVVLFDVGANCGFFSLIRCLTNPGLNAYCFEPHPDTYRRLQRNIFINECQGRVVAINAAVGADCGECHLQISPDSSMGVVAGSSMAGANALGSVTIRMLALDAFARSEGITPDLIKIDVEGFEAQVLKGATACLKSARSVVVECHSRQLANECEAIVASAGFLTVMHDHLLFGDKRT